MLMSPNKEETVVHNLLQPVNNLLNLVNHAMDKEFKHSVVVIRLIMCSSRKYP